MGTNGIQEIAEEKQRLTDSLIEYEASLIANAYGAISRGANAMEIAAAIKNTSLKHLKRNEAFGVRNRVLSYAIGCKRANSRKKYDANGVLIPLGVLAYQWLKRKKVYETVKKTCVYPIANQYERKAKDDAISKVLEEPLPDGNAPIFVLVSAHADSAEDHRDFQGRLYYDRFWQRKVSDPSTRKKVNIFISSEGLKSFQWVIGAPVWMITRPNCRHYFKAISIQDAFENGAETLLSKNGMLHKTGPRGSKQTIRHSTSGAWYAKKENAEAMLKRYKDRLSLLRKMRKQGGSGNEELENDIDKTRLLVRKWKYFLRKL